MKYEIFFKEIKKFKDKQNEQKQRGLNNFNLLTTVRKYHDEVYLHSAMIGAFLDPRGEHYQKTLFLEKFLKVIGLDNWGLNLENATVAIEYKNIDLYITDGIKHIIIENKIFAEDQSCQLTKYINIIVEENKEGTFKNISDDCKLSDELLRVIYLTAQSKKLPEEHKLQDGYIFFDGKPEKLVECSNRDTTKKLVVSGLKSYKARYQKISYKEEILQWLQLSKKEVENITNLNEAFKQYIDVVQMVNKNYKGRVMLLEDYIKEKELDFNLFNLLQNVVQDYKSMIDRTQSAYLEDFEQAIKGAGINSYKDGHIKVPLKNEIYLQTGIEKGSLWVTLYKKEWAPINKEEKDEIFTKVQNISINDKKFEKPSWDGYATINIMSVESREFLDIEKNIDLVLVGIQKIIDTLIDKPTQQ